MSTLYKVVGFPKCGTMSMVEYLKKTHNLSSLEVSRPEDIYEYMPHGGIVDLKPRIPIVITRNPLDRIKSGRQYFTELRNLPVKDMVTGNYPQARRYKNVGFENAIEQSDYNKYIQRYNYKNGCVCGVYKFEDMIKEPDFPRINESNVKIKWTEDEENIVLDLLDKAGITY